MTDEQFNNLVNSLIEGLPLPLVVTRLSLALRAVIEATGPLGDLALVNHCQERTLLDWQQEEGQYEAEG